VAPDISSLAKPAAVRCVHLDDDNRCLDYEGRPSVCRGYRPDDLCRRIAAPTMDERVRRYLAIFDL